MLTTFLLSFYILGMRSLIRRAVFKNELSFPVIFYITGI